MHPTALISSCSKSERCPNETGLKRNVLGTANGPLRIDGYYYMEDDTLSSGERALFTLYADGVIRFSGIMDDGSLTPDSAYTNASYQASLAKEMFHWGVYRLDGSNIVIENRFEQSGECAPYDVRERRGIVLSDTSFQIMRVLGDNFGGTYTEIERYHFRQFSRKLDSANVFIRQVKR